MRVMPGPDRPLPAIAHKPDSARAAGALFQRVKEQQRELVATLPSNYEFLKQMHGTP